MEVETTSMTEAEYVAAFEAAKEILWLGRLAHTFRQVDSDSALVVALSKYLVHHNASKHIDVRYHFVWDYVISGKIGLENISTTDNVADGMTKCLSADRFRSLRHQMGVTKNRTHSTRWFRTTDIGSLRIGLSSSDSAGLVLCLRTLPTRTKPICPTTLYIPVTSV